jgi:uncharacterized NAD(P)/FAD-binding protein YdhS
VQQDLRRRVIVIGGGASGVFLAYHLLSDPTADIEVLLVEKRPDVGRGVAYCTANPDHLLNVRAANMSALPDQPDHFWRWLCAREVGHRDNAGTPIYGDPFCFVSRTIYGDYVASLIEPLLSDDEPAGRLRIIQGECVAISETQSGVEVMLDDRTRHAAAFAVLATGHETLAADDGLYVDPWSASYDTEFADDAPILILGTGLTMVDCVLSLLLAGCNAPIIAMSRRGLLPRAHRHVEPVRIDAADVPFGTELTHLFRWFRTLVKSHMRNGGDWRGVIDGIRPFTQQIWQRLPSTSKRRFLEHARAWWDVHRHRMAPDVERRIHAEIAGGRLDIIAGKLVAVEPNQSGVSVRFRRRGETAIESVQVAKIIHCTGIVTNPLRTTNPALRSLFEQGLARADALHIGIDVSTECAIVDHSGKPSEKLFAIGPLTRAAFWEIIAVPDIRNQCAKLAALLKSRLLLPSNRAAAAALATQPDCQ